VTRREDALMIQVFVASLPTFLSAIDLVKNLHFARDFCVDELRGLD
jgi:hypothetical protein